MVGTGTRIAALCLGGQKEEKGVKAGTNGVFSCEPGTTGIETN
jgi:hypothetical protein